jgi:hypothetical protein
MISLNQCSRAITDFVHVFFSDFSSLVYATYRASHCQLIYVLRQVPTWCWLLELLTAEMRRARPFFYLKLPRDSRESSNDPGLCQTNLKSRY